METTTQEIEITILPELKDLIPPLSFAERENLKYSILAEGVRDAIILWFDKQTGKHILIDGHNRHSIASQLNIGFDYIIREDFENLEAVKKWMIENQLGKRNVNKLTQTYLIGLHYNSIKKQKIDNLKHNASMVQSELSDDNAEKEFNLGNTAEKLSIQYKLGISTIKRAGILADEINRIDSRSKQYFNLKPFLLQSNISFKEVEQLSNATEENYKSYYKFFIHKRNLFFLEDENFNKTSIGYVTQEIFDHILVCSKPKSASKPENNTKPANIYEAEETEEADTLQKLGEALSDKDRDLKAQLVGMIELNEQLMKNLEIERAEKQEGLTIILKYREKNEKLENNLKWYQKEYEELKAETENSKLNTDFANLQELKNLPSLAFTTLQYLVDNFVFEDLTIVRANYSDLIIEKFDSIEKNWVYFQRHESKNGLNKTLKYWIDTKPEYIILKEK